MTHEQQLRWLGEREYRDPYWANVEQEVRRQALEVAQHLRKHGGPVTVAAADPVRGGFTTITITPMRIGGFEQVLLIEAILRRARGLPSDG